MLPPPDSSKPLPPNPPRRALITLERGKFCHNGQPCRVVMTPTKIKIGCTDISIDAAEVLMDAHRQKFASEYVLQS